MTVRASSILGFSAVVAACSSTDLEAFSIGQDGASGHRSSPRDSGGSLDGGSGGRSTLAAGGATSTGTGGANGGQHSAGGTDSRAGGAPSMVDASSIDAPTDADVPTNTCDRFMDDGGTRLDLCARLPNADVLAAQFPKLYVGNFFVDCRVAKASQNPSSVPTFSNDLIQWSLDFWGCRDFGVDTFGLVDLIQFPKLAASDAATLVELYIARARVVLSLSNNEADEMRAALECIAATAVDTTVSAPVLSLCRNSDAGPDASSPDAAAFDANTNEGFDASAPPDGRSPTVDSAADVSSTTDGAS